MIEQWTPKNIHRGHVPSTLRFFPGAYDGANETPEGDEEVPRRVPQLMEAVLAAALKEKGWWDTGPI